MKLLLLAALVAATLQIAAADYTDGVYHTMRDLNDTNVCFDGVFNHTLLETNTSGWAYNATGCSIVENTNVNISGMVLPILYQGVPVVPVGFNFHDNQVGAGSALVVQGPLSFRARMVMPWFVEIIGNVFGRDAQLRFIGSVPINSTITVERNTFDVRNTNPFLTDTLERVVGITIGGNLTTEFEPVSLYRNAHFVVTDNTINVDTVDARKRGTGISILSDVYFTDNTTLLVTKNKVTATCTATLECAGYDSTSYMTLPEDYAGSKMCLDDNTFTVKNGRGFTVPMVWSPNATFYASASRNTVSINLEEAGRSVQGEHAFTFDDSAIGVNTHIEVVQNVVTAIGNTIIFFAGALDITQNAVLNCSWNDIFSTTGDPTVYFIDQTSLTDFATLSINNNRFQRQDNVAVTRPYLSLTYDFSVLGYSLFSFSDNECYPKNSATGPRLAHFTEGKVANVGPTAFLSICRNVYNGNPADLIASQVITPNLLALINCNARTLATTTSETTLPPATTEKRPTVPPTAPPANAATTTSVVLATGLAIAAGAVLTILLS